MCPSEVSDVEDAIWQAYEEEGVTVWGIAAQEPVDAVAGFGERQGLTYPLLLDPKGEIISIYSQHAAFESAAFPQDWVVGSDGRILYVNNVYDPEAIREVIEADLAAP